MTRDDQLLLAKPARSVCWCRPESVPGCDVTALGEVPGVLVLLCKDSRAMSCLG